MSAILYTNIDTGTKFNAGIAEDHTGRIWLASNEKVLALESVQSKDLNYITHTDYTNLSPGAFVSILVDRDNFLMASTKTSRPIAP